MRQSDLMLLGFAAAVLTYVASAPGAAQTDPSAENAPETATFSDPPLNEQQQAKHDSWTPEKQAEYAAWPGETKTYYWSLSPKRQMMFWALATSDKIALTAMTGPERDATWKRIEERAGTPPSSI